MGELIGIARFRFHPGKVEEYKRLSTEAMDIVRARERLAVGPSDAEFTPLAERA